MSHETGQEVTLELLGLSTDNLGHNQISPPSPEASGAVFLGVPVASERAVWYAEGNRERPGGLYTRGLDMDCR